MDTRPLRAGHREIEITKKRAARKKRGARWAGEGVLPLEGKLRSRGREDVVKNLLGKVSSAEKSRMKASA